MKRAVRRTLLGVGLAGVVTAVTVAATVAPSWATPPVHPPPHSGVKVGDARNYGLRVACRGWAGAPGLSGWFAT